MAAGEITQLLERWSQGDRAAADALFTLVYQELRRLARGQRRRLRPGETLDTTAVVHEAYLKLVDAQHVTARDRQHFLALAARAMRQVLVDYARQRHAAKRGGDVPHTDPDREAAVESHIVEVLAVEEALGRLQALDPVLVRIVELHFFAGVSLDETAAALDLSPRTARRWWRRARAFLHHELQPSAAAERG